MSDDTDDDARFAGVDNPDQLCAENELFVLDVNITLGLPGGWIIGGSIAFSALIDILDRLEHDGIRPHRTTIEVTKTTT